MTLTRETAVASELARAAQFNDMQTNIGKELQPKTLTMSGVNLSSIPSTGYVYWENGTIYYDGTAFTVSASNSGADWRDKIIIATLTGGVATISAIANTARIQDETKVVLGYCEASSALLKMNINNNNFIQVPVGGIILWAKNLFTAPELPSNFIECNGQLIEHVDSPLYNQYAPNLNGADSDVRWNLPGTITNNNSTNPNNLFDNNPATYALLSNDGYYLGKTFTNRYIESVYINVSVGNCQPQLQWFNGATWTTFYTCGHAENNIVIPLNKNVSGIRFLQNAFVSDKNFRILQLCGSDESFGVFGASDDELETAKILLTDSVSPTQTTTFKRYKFIIRIM
jgi:hypothetical protein